MNTITWKEFKEEVDKQLTEKGISEDEPIWYIDISYPEKGKIEVFFDESSGILI